MEKIMKPLVPIGFETLVTGDGVFIKNILDGKTFKWISVKNLESNGIDRNGEFCQYGRRNFDASLHNFNLIAFEDPESEQFEQTVLKYGGFYISVDKFSSCNKSEAEHYAKKYLLGSIDAISTLPSGEAFDCMFEYIYELFREYVLTNKKTDETPYAAWNRIAEEHKEDFYKNGIWGIKDLMDGRNEHTSEKIAGNDYCLYRGEHKMSLISYRPAINPEDASWSLSFRAICENFYAYFGYRIMILPK